MIDIQFTPCGEVFCTKCDTVTILQYKQTFTQGISEYESMLNKITQLLELVLKMQ